MTNLPITASTAQIATPGKQSANAAADTDASAQPFGEVLARQIGTPVVKVAKRDDKLAVELAAQTVAETTDIRKDEKAVTEVAGALPTDMLAALLPQVIGTASAAGAVAPVTATAKTDTASAVLTDKPGRAAPRTDLASALPTTDAAKAAPLAAATPGREPSFAATLGEMAGRAVTTAEAGAVAREAAVVAAAVATAAQQPSAASATATMQNAAALAAPVVAQAAQLKVDTPVSQPRWGDEFSQKITWLASSKMDQSAELHLNPPQLGPIDVVIKVSGDQATALFTSPHAAVREAVEQALPRLRDMMADNGITLGNATVSDQAPREQNRSEAQRSAGGGDNELRDSATTGSASARVSPISRHNGIVDTFA